MERETKKILQKYGFSGSNRRVSSIPLRPHTSGATAQRQNVPETVVPKSQSDLIVDQKRLSAINTIEHFSSGIAMRKI